MRVYVIKARKTAGPCVSRLGPALEPGDGGCSVLFKLFLKPFMPQTPTAPGSRLGTDLPLSIINKRRRWLLARRAAGALGSGVPLTCMPE